MARLYQNAAAFQGRSNTAATAAAAGNRLNIDSVCKPGSTLLWDLLSDENIVSSDRGQCVLTFQIH